VRAATNVLVWVVMHQCVRCIVENYLSVGGVIGHFRLRGWPLWLVDRGSSPLRFARDARDARCVSLILPIDDDITIQAGPNFVDKTNAGGPNAKRRWRRKGRMTLGCRVDDG
jgi:hypothetical protein